MRSGEIACLHTYEWGFCRWFLGDGQGGFRGGLCHVHGQLGRGLQRHPIPLNEINKKIIGLVCCCLWQLAAACDNCDDGYGMMMDGHVCVQRKEELQHC